MYKNILVATDGSELAARAVAQAADLARAFGARLTIVTVTVFAPSFDHSELGWSVPQSVFDEIRKVNADKSRDILEAAKAKAGLDATTLHREAISPYDGILSAASEIGADLIVVGSHGYRGIDRLILGSQAAKVLSHAKVPVLVVKSEPTTA